MRHPAPPPDRLGHPLQSSLRRGRFSCVTLYPRLLDSEMGQYRALLVVQFPMDGARECATCPVGNQELLRRADGTAVFRRIWRLVFRPVTKLFLRALGRGAAGLSLPSIPSLVRFARDVGARSLPRASPCRRAFRIRFVAFSMAHLRMMSRLISPVFF